LHPSPPARNLAGVTPWRRQHAPPKLVLLRGRIRRQIRCRIGKERARHLHRVVFANHPPAAPLADPWPNCHIQRLHVVQKWPKIAAPSPDGSAAIGPDGCTLRSDPIDKGVCNQTHRAPRPVPTRCPPSPEPHRAGRRNTPPWPLLRPRHRPTHLRHDRSRPRPPAGTPVAILRPETPSCNWFGRGPRRPKQVFAHAGVEKCRSSQLPSPAPSEPRSPKSPSCAKAGKGRGSGKTKDQGQRQGERMAKPWVARSDPAAACRPPCGTSPVSAAARVAFAPQRLHIVEVPSRRAT